jgi:hypothetical protein
MTDSQFRVAPNFDFYTEALLEQTDVTFAPFLARDANSPISTY